MKHLTPGNSRTALLCVAIFGFIGIIFISVALGMFFSQKNTKEKCTEQIQADVVELKESYDEEDGGTTYAPVVGYEVDGKYYEVARKLYTNPCSYYVGQKVEIMYAPDEPDKMYIVGDSGSTLMIYIFGGIGCIFIIIVIVMAISAIAVTRNQTFVQKEQSAENQYFSENSEQNFWDK